MRIPSFALLLPFLALAGPAAHAQPKSLGKYTGTIEVSGTQHGPEVTYKATVKALTLPVSERKESWINAEFLAGEAPNATVLVTQWDSFHREKHADSGGQFNTRTCKLAAPVEIPMSVTGVLNVDLKKKRHSMSLVLLGMKDVAFNCVHSRSGASKEKGGVGFALGTGVPGSQDETQLPFTDAAQLSAKYTLVPAGGYEKQYGPVVQEWNLKLAP